MRALKRVDLLELDVDCRISLLWEDADDVEEWDLEAAVAFMRAAYARGYWDAHVEARSNSLFTDNGYPIPVKGTPG